MNGATQQAKRNWKQAQRDWKQARRDWDRARRNWKQAGPDWEQARPAWEQARQDREQAMQAWEQARQAWEQARRAWEQARPVPQWVKKLRKRIKQNQERTMQKSEQARQKWTEQAGKSMKDFLDWMSPARIGALYAFAVVTSIFFDLIYLGALGIFPMAAPISISDHIRSSVIWIPPVLIVALATHIVSLLWSRFHEGLLNNIYKMSISLILLILMVVLAPLAMWWWIWEVFTPYDFSSSEEIKNALKFLRSTMIQLVFWIWALFMVIFCAFPIYRSKITKTSMNLHRIESMILSGFSFALFMFFFISIASISNQLSELGACVQALSPKSSITVNDKKFAIFRSFEKYFLVSNCEKNQTEFKFLNVDKVDIIMIHKQNDQNQNTTGQPENSGVDLNSTNSSTPLEASQSLPPSAGRR